MLYQVWRKPKDKEAWLLFLPVSAIVVLMENLEPHKRTITSNHCAVRLRQPNRIFPGIALGFFPLKAVVSEYLVPSHPPELLERLQDLLDLGDVQIEQF